jgi:hypothetical protein
VDASGTTLAKVCEHYWNRRPAAADSEEVMKEPNPIAVADATAEALARRVFVLALAGVVAYTAVVLALLASAD